MKRGFDKRLVFYEHIHNIRPKDEKALVDAINPRPKEKILDAFCGYGSVSKNCLKKEKEVEMWLNDESPVQIDRARKNLPLLPSSRFILGDFLKSNFNQKFDKVVIKMGLHEVSKENQIKILKKSSKILRPRGRLIIWDIMLNHDTQKLFQDVIREKDRLAKFDSLVKNRYFFREDEFIDNLKKAGFAKIKEFHKMNYQFSSLKRLESEFNGNEPSLEKFNSYIKKIFPEDLKKQLKYSERGQDCQFTITKKIFVVQKP